MKKTLKKTLTVLLISSLIACFFGINAFAEETEHVYVTISSGSLVVCGESVELKDLDEDGALTINDALIAAHDAFYAGGAAEGYGSAVSQYGLGMTKLWGIENGGSYGYYVNDAAAFALTDTLKDGDYVYAYVYTDTVAFSDIYSFFDKKSITAAEGESIELTLSFYSYDENWNLVENKLSGATIIINDNDTDIVTDEEGKAVIAIEGSEKLFISAKHNDAILVPPLCIVNVEGKTSETGSTETDTTGESTETSATQSASASETETTAAATVAPTQPTTPKTGDMNYSLLIALIAASALCAVLAAKKAVK